MAAGCGDAALVAWAATAVLAWSSVETKWRHRVGLLARNQREWFLMNVITKNIRPLEKK